MDKLKVSNLCICLAKDVLEISTHASRDDKRGVRRQIKQINKKCVKLEKLLNA